MNILKYAMMRQTALKGGPSSGGNVAPASPAIIDVTELPTENIREDCFYRLMSSSLVFNQFVQNMYTVHCVETLPETGLPASNIDQTEGNVYYNVLDGEAYGYVDDILSVGLGVPSGWYPVATLLGASGFEYAGVITNILDDPQDSKFRLLLEYVVYDHKNGNWTSHNNIGWAGAGTGAEIFNHPDNMASGVLSHAEGMESHAEGDYSHAEGHASHAEGHASHAEGHASHAEGYYSHAEGVRSHAEGYSSHAEGNSSHAEGDYSHAEGMESHAEGVRSHAEGYYSHAEGHASHVEGVQSHAEGYGSHAEGYYSHAEGNYSHAEGHASHAEGDYSHAEGHASHAEGDYSHAEGNGSTIRITITGELNATVYNIASSAGLIAGASVRRTIMTDNVPEYVTAKIISIDTANSTIVVNRTLSEDKALDSEMVEVYVSGLALGAGAHVEGWENIAAGRGQHVQGEYNAIDPDYDVDDPTDGNNKRTKYAHIVGNGTSHTNRSNAHTLDWEGNAWYAGSVEGTALILKSPSGTRFRITVGDDGVLSATAAE